MDVFPTLYIVFLIIFKRKENLPWLGVILINLLNEIKLNAYLEHIFVILLPPRERFFQLIYILNIFLNP
jgi:hypothetical protein